VDSAASRECLSTFDEASVRYGSFDSVAASRPRSCYCAQDDRVYAVLAATAQCAFSAKNNPAHCKERDVRDTRRVSPLRHHRNPQFPQLPLRHRCWRLAHQILGGGGFGEGNYFAEAVGAG
jgi:hypothetical protein